MAAATCSCKRRKTAAKPRRSARGPPYGPGERDPRVTDPYNLEIYDTELEARVAAKQYEREYGGIFDVEWAHYGINRVQTWFVVDRTPGMTGEDRHALPEGVAYPTDADHTTRSLAGRRTGRPCHGRKRAA